jgi:hypothetical protein
MVHTEPAAPGAPTAAAATCHVASLLPSPADTVPDARIDCCWIHSPCGAGRSARTTRARRWAIFLQRSGCGGGRLALGLVVAAPARALAMADARAPAGGVLAERSGWRARERAGLSEGRQRCRARTRGRGGRRGCALFLETSRELRRRAPGAPGVGAALADSVVLVAGIRLVPLARGRDVAARFGADRAAAAGGCASARRRCWIGRGWRRGGRGRRICRAGCQQRAEYECQGQVSHAGLPDVQTTGLGSNLHRPVSGSPAAELRWSGQNARSRKASGSQSRTSLSSRRGRQHAALERQERLTGGVRRVRLPLDLLASPNSRDEDRVLLNAPTRVCGSRTARNSAGDPAHAVRIRTLGMMRQKGSGEHARIFVLSKCRQCFDPHHQRLLAQRPGRKRLSVSFIRGCAAPPRPRARTRASRHR